jgi:hypothetical protein
MATGVGIDFYVKRNQKPNRNHLPYVGSDGLGDIFWGLLFNTLLVLVVVPTFLLLIGKAKEKKWEWG